MGPHREGEGTEAVKEGSRAKNGDRSPSPSRTRTGPGRDAAALFQRRRLIMTGPGRSRALPARPWPRRLRRRGVLATRKPLLSFRLPARFLLRAPGPTFAALLFQEPPRTTRRLGAGQAPGTGCPRGANHPSRKIARRRRHVSACAACATQAPTAAPPPSGRRSPPASVRAVPAGGCGNAGRCPRAAGAGRRAAARTRGTSPVPPPGPRTSWRDAATGAAWPGTPRPGRARRPAAPHRRRTPNSAR